MFNHIKESGIIYEMAMLSMKILVKSVSILEIIGTVYLFTIPLFCEGFINNQ